MPIEKEIEPRIERRVVGEGDGFRVERKEVSAVFPEERKFTLREYPEEPRKGLKEWRNFLGAEDWNYKSTRREEVALKELAKQHPEVFQNAIQAQVEAGDVFLWLDQTVHGAIGGRGEGPTKPELSRAVVFVSMSRKALASPATLREREEAVRTNHGNGHTSHHPLQGRSRPGEPGPWAGPESLSEAQRQLIS